MSYGLIDGQGSGVRSARVPRETMAALVPATALCERGSRFCQNSLETSFRTD